MQWYVYALLSISRTRQMQINEPYVEKTIAHMDTYGQTSWSILESPKRHWFSQTWGCKRPAFAVSLGLKLYLTMMTLEFGIAQLYSIIEILLDTSRAGKKNDINRAETTKNRETIKDVQIASFRCVTSPQCLAGRSQTCEGHVSHRRDAHAPW